MDDTYGGVGRVRGLATEIYKGQVCIGEHGSEWQRPAKPKVFYSAITACGYETLFSVAPTTGEEIFCRRCDTWEVCRVVGGCCVACDDCDLHEEFGHDFARANRRLKGHAVGRDGQRKLVHRARMGKHTREGVEWSYYQRSKGANAES